MKNIIKVPLITFWTIILSLQSSASFACTCFYGGEFAKNATRYQGVIRAKVIGYGDNHDLIDIHNNAPVQNLYKSIIVEVTDVIKGKLNYSKLELMGDRGADCREYADSRKYGIGKEFLFVIRNEEQVQELAGCGESSILVDNDTVKGYRFTNGGYETYSMSVDALVKEMKIEAIKYEKIKQNSE